MTFLPIVERELRIAARLTATYRNRVIIAAIVTGVAMVMFTFGAFSAFPAQTGRAMFWTLSYMSVVFCLFEGVRKTADCLSEEKREGTLGLLFLTDLRGYDIILGKLTARSVNSVYGLLSVLPIMALPLLLGGTTVGEYWRMVLALTNLLFFSLCAGIWVSCWCRDERQAMTATFLLILVWVAAPWFALHPTWSPLFSVEFAGDMAFRTAPGGYWSSIVHAQLGSWAMLVWASFAVPHCWRDEKFRSPGTRWWQRWTSTHSLDAQGRAAARTQMLETNPAFWLASHDAGQNGVMPLFIAVAAVLSLGMVIFFDPYFWAFIACFWLLNFAIKMRVATQACHCLAEARRTNALEMLLVTPLTSEQLIYGQILAMQRRFTKPIIAILSLEAASMVIGFSFWQKSGNDAVPGLLIVSFGLLCYLALSALDIVALTWTGMVYGLSSRKESQAVAKTILIVLVAPLLCLLMFCYGTPFIIGIPLVCIFNNRVKLRHEFRKLAGQPYAPPQDQRWLPGGLAQPTPMQQNP